MTISNIKKTVLLGLLLSTYFLFTCQSSEEAFDQKLPEEDRFTVAALNEPGSLDEPMAFSFTSTEELLVVERKGSVKAFNITSKEMKQVGFVPVNTKYVNKEGKSREAEEGLMGVIAHPNFATNNLSLIHI